jgi:cytochrome c biogenesis protein
MSLLKLKKASEGLHKFGEFIASVRLTATLLFILIPVAILGSLIPQEREYAEYAERFGFKWTGLLYQLKLNTVFLSPWFLILIVLLGTNILSCLVMNLIKTKRTFGFILVHLSLVLLIAGGLTSATMRIKGDITLNEGQSAASFTHHGKTIPLGFELRLKDFELQHYENELEKLVIAMPEQKTPLEFRFRKEVWTLIPGSDYQFRVERFLPDFRYDMASRTAFSASQEPNNPAILVHMKGKDEDYTEWVFSNFSDFHMTKERPIGLKYFWAQKVPKAFISHIEILEKGKVVKEQAIRVNHPLRYKGFSFYQSTYDSINGEWSGLAVVRDPGTRVVFASSVMIMLGLIQNIYFHPSRRKKRKIEDEKQEPR